MNLISSIDLLLHCYRCLRFFCDKWLHQERSLSVEQSVLKSLIKRKKNAFQNDKGFMDLQQLEKSIRRLWEVKLLKTHILLQKSIVINDFGF